MQDQNGSVDAGGRWLSPSSRGDLRFTKRLADLERRDRESQDRKRLRQGADKRGGGDGDLEQGHQPEVAEQTQSGANPGDVVAGDDMGIPLATDDVMCSAGKRNIEDVEGSGAPSATRQKLECVFNVEKKQDRVGRLRDFQSTSRVPGGKRSGLTRGVLVEKRFEGHAHQ